MEVCRLFLLLPRGPGSHRSAILISQTMPRGTGSHRSAILNSQTMPRGTGYHRSAILIFKQCLVVLAFIGQPS